MGLQVASRSWRAARLVHAKGKISFLFCFVFFLFHFHVCLYMKNYTKDRKNLQYTKVFQRIKFIGKSWYQQTQTVHNTEVPILCRCP